MKTIECLNSTLINLVLDNFITAETCFVLNMIFLNSIGADHVHTDGQDRELNTSTMFSHCHRTSYCSFADGNLAWPSRSTFKVYFRIRDYVSFETFIPVILLIIIRNGSIGLLFCLHAKPDAQIKNFKKSVPTIYPRANAECLYDSIPKVERLKIWLLQELSSYVVLLDAVCTGSSDTWWACRSSVQDSCFSLLILFGLIPSCVVAASSSAYFNK